MPSATSRRHLGLWLPFLPTERLRRQRHRCVAPAEAPLALVERIRSALRLAAVDRLALAQGLAPGLTLADARARCPGLVVAELDRAADARFLERLAERCDRYTPLVALDPPAGLLLDITGCAQLFGGEAGLRDDLLRRLAGAGLTACASIADTAAGARALARCGGPAIVPPGGQAMAVGALPIAALDGAPETVVALRRAGLKTIAELAAQPRPGLAARFGPALVVELARLLGADELRPAPRRPRPPDMAERHFAEPIARLEDVLHALAGLAARLARRLEAREAGGRRFVASFHRSDGKVLRLEVGTSRPSRDPELLMRLFRERLDALTDPLDPGFGFDRIRLRVTACEAQAAVQADLDGRAAAAEEVAALVDRLAAAHGSAAVLRFQAVDTHQPEQAARLVSAAGGDARSCAWPAPEPGAPPGRPIHLFDPPQPIDALAEVPDGPPRRFRWRRVLHEVTRAEGPERIAPVWWRAGSAGAPRDYYRLEDAAGRRFWIFRAGLYGAAAAPPRWFLHGLFA